MRSRVSNPEVSKDQENLSSRRFQGFDCICPSLTPRMSRTNSSRNPLYNTYFILGNVPVFQSFAEFLSFFLFFATNNEYCICNTRYNILLSISCAIAVHHNFDPFLEFGILALLHRRNDFCVREQPCESGRRSYFAFRRFLFLQKEQDFE